MKPPYLDYKTYLIARHGHPLFRVPIDLQNGCPNRAADGSGGCTFCNERGARAVQTTGAESAEEQIAIAIRFARDRYGAKKFMAYIQAFSATFEPEQQQRYRHLLSKHKFQAVSFGTHPDGLTAEAYRFLTALSAQTEVWVDLGVQTVHNCTLEKINRGHTWEANREAILRLHDCGIQVAVHVILGLPGETPDDFKATANTLAALPIDAIKIHNLHLLKGSELAHQHEKKPVPVLMEYPFAEQLMEFIRRLPPHIPIMRLTTDTLDDELIAPRWQMDKNAFKEYIIQQMTCREWQQGDLYDPTLPPLSCPEPEPIKTADGSSTFWNRTYKEHYHTPAGARLEALGKYVEPARLRERLDRNPVQLLDICFGLGYNSLLAMETATRATHRLDITALEMDRRVVRAAATTIQPQKDDTLNWQEILTALHRHGRFETRHAVLEIQWGDARYTATQLEAGRYDVVFLDAFSTQRNSELWTVDFFRTLKTLMKPDAVLLTYCAALPVRAGLIEAGFFVGETEPIGRVRGGTIAVLNAEAIVNALSADEQTTLHTTSRGLPYRDPYGVWSNKDILRDRQERILTEKRRSRS